MKRRNSPIKVMNLLYILAGYVAASIFPSDDWLVIVTAILITIVVAKVIVLLGY